jgi:hypothetical protein
MSKTAGNVWKSAPNIVPSNPHQNRAEMKWNHVGVFQND